MLPIFQQFTWRDGLFSVKAFIAAMLALWIAFRLDLSQPSWCITTVYVVSQPLAGMVLAKSLYRVLGTVIGAVMSLIFVALFSNNPELFCLALAIWIGVCTWSRSICATRRRPIPACWPVTRRPLSVCRRR